MKAKLGFILIIFSCILSGLQAQVHKRFVDGRDKPVKDSTKAMGYVLYQRTEDSSEWSAVWMTKKNVPYLKGYYLDEELTIANGKVSHYREGVLQHKIGDHQSTIDTVLVLTETGYYANGMREGNFVTYNIFGHKLSLETFRDDTLNGTSEMYFSNGGLRLQGNYQNGLRIGDWYQYKPDSTVLLHEYYVNGQVKKTEDFSDKHKGLLYRAYCKYDFYDFIGKWLKAAGFPPTHGDIVVSFTISADGRLTEPKLLIGIDKSLDEAILDAIKNSPYWVPAEQDKVPVAQQITIAFEYREDGRKH